MSVHTESLPVSRQQDWEAATPYPEWVAHVEDLAELWASATSRASVAEDLVARVEAALGTWRILVLTEDWCIDATATAPTIAQLAAEAGNLDLRVLNRDEHLYLMDQHLTNGTARSIPVAILLDGEGVERGWWGPRPTDLQAWFEETGRGLESEERYRELRKWYARDRGQTTAREIVELIEHAAGAGAVL